MPVWTVAPRPADCTNAPASSRGGLGAVELAVGAVCYGSEAALASSLTDLKFWNNI